MGYCCTEFPFSVSDQDETLQVEALEKIEQEFIVLPLNDGVAVSICVSQIAGLLSLAR